MILLVQKNLLYHVASLLKISTHGSQNESGHIYFKVDCFSFYFPITVKTKHLF